MPSINKVYCLIQNFQTAKYYKWRILQELYLLFQSQRTDDKNDWQYDRYEKTGKGTKKQKRFSASEKTRYKTTLIY